jgi:hypothetical protein
MFTRRVSMHLKPNSVVDFTRTIEKDILPLVRNQLVGHSRERGSLQPRNLSRSNKDPGESG